MHLLFWLSLIPFATAWSGENHFASLPVAMYGVPLMMSGIAYYLLTLALLRAHGPDSDLAKALGSDFKGKISVVFYAAAIVGACWYPPLALGIYVLVAVIWLIPDRRMERVYRKP